MTLSDQQLSGSISDEGVHSKQESMGNMEGSEVSHTLPDPNEIIMMRRRSSGEDDEDEG